MYKTYLYLALALLSFLPVRAANLTVIVAVDGLDEASLREMQPYWSPGGLRTLSEEAYQTVVSYPHWLYGGDEALATLLTGCTPSVHGICSNKAFSRETRKSYEIFLSDKKQGIGAALSYCCDALLAPTIIDRKRISGDVNSQVYAIGIHPTTTLLLAGHSANACCWLETIGKTDKIHWVSTSYYKEGLPSVADKMNVDGTLNSMMEREWLPRMEPTSYNHPTAEEKHNGFAYKGHQALFTSPNTNAAIIELALHLQKEKNLGKNTNRSDVLLLELTTITPKAQQETVLSAEQEDMYLRLNQDLGYLMEQLSRRIGKDQLRVVVMGLPKLGVSTSRMAEWNMRVRTFDIEKAVALTSSYLMALYGHERWVDGGEGQSIYLNRTLIEQKHLSLETIRRQVADFLMEFDGVSYACPANEAFVNPNMQASLHKRFVGDVVFMLQSNYTLSGCPLLPATCPLSPVMIWSPSTFQFPPATLHDATELAPYIL